MTYDMVMTTVGHVAEKRDTANDPDQRRGRRVGSLMYPLLQCIVSARYCHFVAREVPAFPFCLYRPGTDFQESSRVAQAYVAR